LLAFVERFYGIKHMVKPDLRVGDLPSTGQAYRDVIRIAIPAVAEMVLMALIGAMDTAMVGVLGAEAISAVGLPGQPRMIMLAIFFALNIGVTAVVARRKGEGRQEDANRTLRNALVTIGLLSFVIMAVSLNQAENMIRLASGDVDPADLANVKVFNDAIAYFRWMAYALPVNAITMCISAAQRGIGKTRTTMVVNITSNVVNVIFNYLLIGGNLGFPRLGVEGAAIATFIGFCVGLVLSVCSVTLPRFKGFLYLRFRDNWRLDKITLRDISRVGGNAMLEQICLRIGFLLYARLIYEALHDPVAFASHQIGMQFLNISFTFGDGIGIAGTSLVGQMLGKQRPDLSMVYGKVSQRMALTVSAGLILIFIPLRHILVLPFASDLKVLALAAQVMIVVGIFQPFQTSSVVISGCLRGAGDTRYVAVVMMLCVTLIRPILAWTALYPLQLGLLGAWSASLVDMIVRLTFVYVRFTKGKWMYIKV
jgi:putative MATE family efflux protein